MNKVAYVSNILHLFVQHRWPMEFNDPQSPLRLLMNLGEFLEADERKLITSLMRSFKRISLIEYQEYFFKVIKKIDINFLDKTKIHVLPIFDIENENNGKSSSHFAYIFEDLDLRRRCSLRNKNVKVLPKNIETIPRSVRTKNDEILYLVDDFVGSGTTVSGLINALIDKNIPKSKMKVIAAAAMDQGIDKLSEMGIDYFFAYTQSKGISKIQNSILKERNTEIMQRIEAKFNFPDWCKFGYMRSESLIKMIRTPDML